MKKNVFFIGDFLHLEKPLRQQTGEFEFDFFANMDDMAFFVHGEKPQIIMVECGNHPNLADKKTSLLCHMVTNKIKIVFPDTFVVFFGDSAMLENCLCVKQSKHIDYFFEKTANPDAIFSLLRNFPTGK